MCSFAIIQKSDYHPDTNVFLVHNPPCVFRVFNFSILKFCEFCSPKHTPHRMGHSSTYIRCSVILVCLTVVSAQGSLSSYVHIFFCHSFRFSKMPPLIRCDTSVHSSLVHSSVVQWRFFTCSGSFSLTTSDSGWDVFALSIIEKFSLQVSFVLYTACYYDSTEIPILSESLPSFLSQPTGLVTRCVPIKWMNFCKQK